MDPHQPNRYVRCGATTTVGGDIICLKCARTNAWIRTEGWRVLTEDELGEVWTNVPQQENEVVPGMNTSRQELIESDDPIPVGQICLVTGMIGRQCWHPGCLLQGFQLCEHRSCNEYACGAHSFSIFLPDGSLTAIWCSRHRRPDVTNKYLPFRRMSCCKCGSDSNIVG
eukprot:3600660-Amphidinium_carterae.1